MVFSRPHACGFQAGQEPIIRASTMTPAPMVVAVVIMHRHKNRETAADADHGHGENEGGKYPFHGISK
jgi:hypothetical protein